MQQLAVVTDFAAQAADPARYTVLGPDWAVAAADVTGSTRLAAAGRSRDVNFVAGAAVAVLSALLEQAGHRPCCQFGGDGAIAAIPPGLHDQARAALAALVDWSTNELDVPIRAGLVTVSELTAAGHEVRAALQDLGGGNVFGLFTGSGAAAAEDWIKADPARQVIPRPGPLPGLEALSCRWSPAPASRGVVLSIIIDPLARGADGDAVLSRVAGEIETVVRTQDAAPLSPGGEKLVPRWPPSLRSLWLESRVVPPGRRAWRVARAVVQSGLVKLIDLSGQKIFGFEGKAYRRSLAERCDYRKAAGGPRMVLDVTEAEAQAIETLLERQVAAGNIRYGLARSDSVTITCRVGDFAADRHVHFVDGAELGFWRASVALKQRFHPDRTKK